MRIKNVIFIIFLLMSLILTINTISYAKVNPNSFKPSQIQTSKVSGVVKLGEKITGGITAVGTVVAVATTLVMGIKYMVGSVEEKAEYKKSMMPMLIGMILLFGVSWIVKLIYTVMTSINI